jgi:hypothetical protein
VIPLLDRFDGCDMGGSYGGYLAAWTIANVTVSPGDSRNTSTPKPSLALPIFGSFFSDGGYTGTDAQRMREQELAGAGKARWPVRQALVIHSEDDLRCPLQPVNALLRR